LYGSRNDQGYVANLLFCAGDPFDALVVAAAQSLRLPLITRDAADCLRGHLFARTRREVEPQSARVARRGGCDTGHTAQDLQRVPPGFVSSILNGASP
jgi:hypothetical protein